MKKPNPQWWEIEQGWQWLIRFPRTTKISYGIPKRKNFF